jgi:glycosyltransferase involved in cell wall biosynthesis
MNTHTPQDGRPYISVAIPTYEMRGLGAQFLRESFDILVQQTFKDFDVVVSDNSTTNVIKEVCDEYKDKLDIKYHKHNGRKEMSPNTNNAIACSTGKLIKIIFQDDFLYGSTSLQEIVDNFDIEKDHWLVTACEHSRDGKTFFRSFYPTYNDNIHLGNNTISSPSVLTIKNDHPLEFDNEMKWFMDCDYYKRCYEKFGPPKILNIINAVNRLGAHQTTNILSDLYKEQEYAYVLKKYNIPNRQWLLLKSRINRYIRYLKHIIKKLIRRHV